VVSSTTKAVSPTRDLAKRHVDELEEDVHTALDKRIARLRHELASITEAVHSFSIDTYDGALDMVDDARHQAARAGRHIGRQANAAGHVIKDNPVPITVVLAAIALLTAVVLQRRDS
jgi:hypothetical protein